MIKTPYVLLVPADSPPPSAVSFSTSADDMLLKERFWICGILQNSVWLVVLEMGGHSIQSNSKHVNYKGGSRARNLELELSQAVFQPLLLAFTFTCLKPRASSILRLTVFAGVYEHRWSINLRHIAKKSKLLLDLGFHVTDFAFAR